MLNSNIAAAMFQIKIQLQVFSCSVQHINAYIIIFISNYIKEISKKGHFFHTSLYFLMHYLLKACVLSDLFK